MRFPGPFGSTLASCRLIIWLASWIVPTRERQRWRDRWNRQIFHWWHFLVEAGQLSGAKQLELARFCWSSFPSAFWNRFDRDRFLGRWEQFRRSPSACLGVIALALIAVSLLGGIIPTVRSLVSSAIPDPDRLWVISLDGKFRRVRSETLIELAKAWKQSKLVEAVAAYSWGAGTLKVSHDPVQVLWARVAPEFFQVLQVNAALGRTLGAGDEQGCSNCVVLSDDIWRIQFHRDPGILGRAVLVDGIQRIVIGVLPRDFHILSPQIAVWTPLDYWAPSFTNSVERIGAVARVKPGVGGPNLEADLANVTENAGYVFPASLLVVTSGRVEMRRYMLFYLLFVLLAVACATLIVYARSDSDIGRAPLSLRDRWRWWSFFVAKALLLLALSCVVAWSLVHWFETYVAGSQLPLDNGIALWLFLAMSVAPLSWAIGDQQKRCRVCLRRLGTPVPIGAPGRVLLDWSGTEMVCAQGHGVLYLPDSQTNWLQRARWDNFDESWSELFRKE